MNQERQAAMAVIVNRAITGISPRVEGMLMAFECVVACELRTARDRAGWPFGQAIWDEVYSRPFKIRVKR